VNRTILHRGRAVFLLLKENGLPVGSNDPWVIRTY